MEASSALVPSLQALHKDALKNRKKERGELTASSRFTVAKGMTSCEPPFVYQGRAHRGRVKGTTRRYKDRDSTRFTPF